MESDNMESNLKKATVNSVAIGGGASLAAYLFNMIPVIPDVPVIATGAGALTGYAAKKGKPLEAIIGVGVGTAKVSWDIVTIPINPLGSGISIVTDVLTYVTFSGLAYAVTPKKRIEKEVKIWKQTN